MNNAEIVLPPLRQRLGVLAALFLRLGITGFGGPAAHIAMMHAEVVKRRKWLNDQEFLDLLGATNLIPGPNSTEMAIHIGYLRAGWPGLIVAGVCFILPAMLIVMALAWVYVQYGATLAAGWLLYGIKPAIIAVVALALWDLGRKALKGPLTVVVGLGVAVASLLNVSEIALLLAGGLIVMIGLNLGRARIDRGAAVLFPMTAVNLGAIAAAAAAPFSLGVLFFTFFKIGSLLYGSGYVLLAFLRAEFVTGLGWLTDTQILDAIAIGQVTPGPVLTTATFIGYVLGGAPGAVLATLGIFLPAFVFVAISNPFIPRLRKSAWVGGLLDGVNAASLGLMAAVTIQLGQASLVDPLTIGIGIVSFVLLLKFKLNATWLVVGGALIGLASALWR
jgi:chromate transporter